MTPIIVCEELSDVKVHELGVDYDCDLLKLHKSSFKAPEVNLQGIVMALEKTVNRSICDFPTLPSKHYQLVNPIFTSDGDIVMQVRLASS